MSSARQCVKSSQCTTVLRATTPANTEWQLVVDVLYTLGYHIFVGKLYGFVTNNDRNLSLTLLILAIKTLT